MPSSVAAIGRALPTLATALLCALVLAGCGGGDDADSAATETTASSDVQSTLMPARPNAPDATQQGSGPETLRMLPPAPRPKARVKPRIAGLEGATTEEAVVAIAVDVADFWQRRFNAVKVEFQPATAKVIRSGSVETRCGSVAAGDPPQYCATDTSLALPLPWFEKNAAPIGDFAVGYAVATTWGYHVAAQLGLADELDDAKEALLTDCLAGNWAASIYQKDALQEGDLEEGARLISEFSPSKEDAQAHAAAFDKGFAAGNSGNCVELAS